MEAPPHRPGHAGFTPQPIGPRVQASRGAGVLTSTAIRAFGELRAYVGQVLPRLQAPEREHTVLTMLQVDQAARGLSEAQPWPFDFRDGYRMDTAPRRGADES